MKVMLPPCVSEAVEEPAVRTTLPPSPESLSPIDIAMDPEVPAVARPVEILTQPLFPSYPVPVRSRIGPLAPQVPELAVSMMMEPEVVADE